MKKTLHFIILLPTLLLAQTPTPTTITQGAGYTITGLENLTATQKITLGSGVWIKQGSTFVAKIVADGFTGTDFNNSAGTTTGSPAALNGENYIYTRSFKKPMQTPSGITQNSDVTESITYFDGLGRPKQNIGIKQSGTGQDIITHIEYDAFGRQTMDFLPYTTSNNAVFDSAAITNTLSFYNTPKYENTANPYSQKLFESSPLNRVLKQAAPGTDWTLGNGHEIKLDYQTNTATDAVNLFSITVNWNATTQLYDIPTTLTATTYADSQLYKTITYDENTAATPIESNGSTVEFKNKEGQVVLKRTYNAGVKHDTYYVYDQYGNLTYVIPPKADATLTQLILDDLCYQYKYDYRNRLVEKKLPGKQWEFIVYDKLDRVVATGPAFSPFSDITTSGWLITKYDAFNRPVYTGWENTTATRATKQTAQNGLTTSLNEAKSAPGVIDGVGTFYTNTVAPTVLKILTVNYYDDYNFPNAPTTLPALVETQTVFYNTTTKPKALPTGSWVRIPETSALIKNELSYTLYDNKARPIRSYTTNHLGGYTYTDSKLDLFSGQLQYSITRHKRLTTDVELMTKDAFTYSPQDRLLTHTHQINNGVTQTLVANTYDELGQLTSKNVGGTTAPLQKVDYTYNIRGWLTGINDINTLTPPSGVGGTDLFAFKLNYNTTENCTGYTGTPLYNGNIAETYWRTATDNVQRKYGYQYDQLNRLKNAIYQKPGATPALTSVTNMYNETLTYDKNGNIQTLLRNGDTDTQIGVMPIDNLTYTYGANTNQLQKVADTANKASGFIDGTNTTNDYTYDLNGNLITDANKTITAITYNHLNLPTKITFGTTGNITYIYNATGQKLEKIVTQGAAVTSTNYLVGFQYSKPPSGVWGLQYFPTAEGYVNKTGTVYSYVYNYTDHLGNVRVSYGLNTTNVLTIFDENNYYPFGLKHKGYNAIAPAPSYKYKYNGKELQDELGLNTFDLGARHYMPDIGRFAVIDPMADFVNYQSPYVISDNNPVLNVDEYGLGILNVIGNLFQRLKFAISKIGTNCNCSKFNGESVGRAFDRPDFPNSGGGNNSRSTPTPSSTGGEGKQPTVVGVNKLNPVGITMNDNINIQVPQINVPIPRNSSNADVDSIRLVAGNPININISFNSFSPTIDEDASSKTLNDLLKTLTEYPQILLLIQGNVRNKNFPNLKKNTSIVIDGVDGTVGDLQLLRAKAIKKFLVDKGIDPERLSVGQGVISKNSRSATLQSQ